MLLLAVSLICISVAFVAGWLLSKICLGGGGTADTVSRERVHRMLHAQRDRYRQRIASLYKLVRRHEKRREEIEHKLSSMQATLEARSTNDDSARAMLEAEQTKTMEIEHELSLLRIQRDALIAKVERRNDERQPSDRANPETDPERVAELRAELGELRSELAARNHRVRRLELLLAEVTERENQALARLSEWKRRVQPLTQQLRLQRDLIRRLRDEPDPSSAEPQVTSDPLPAADECPDDLKKIRGIGPALERRLRAHGISRYRQIAEMSDDELARVAAELAIAPTLPARDQWIEQARSLHLRHADQTIAQAAQAPVE